MARIKIDLPARFGFATHIPIRITDLNYGAHVGNDTILSLVHEARVQFLQHQGFSELQAGGSGLIMGDVAITFHQELFYGDLVKIQVAAGDFSRVGFDLFYKLEKEKEGVPVVAALAKTGMVCYDYSAKKIMPVPEVLKKALTLPDW